MALAYKEKTQKDLGGILYYPVNQKRKEQLPAHKRLQCATSYVKNIREVEE